MTLVDDFWWRYVQRYITSCASQKKTFTLILMMMLAKCVFEKLWATSLVDAISSSSRAKWKNRIKSNSGIDVNSSPVQ